MSVTAIASRRSVRTDDDRALARRAGRGDEAAFAELYDRHAAGLVGFSQQYVGDRAAAEDVVQQTFLSAFRTLRGGTALEHPRAWLYHVARNNSLTLVRDRPPAALGSPLEEELLDRAAAVPAQIEQREALEEVVRDIVSLPAQQRAALALFEVGDLSQAEIGQILDCSPAQVKALVFQARSALVSRREARSATCASIRESLLAARGGALNRRLIRHHLRVCEPCTAFRDDLRDGRRRVALLLPVLPAAALRESVLGAAAGSGHAHATAGAVALARPRHPWWIAGGTAATVGAVGLATLAWPGASHQRPDAAKPRPVAATATAEPVKLGGAPPAMAKAAPAAAARSAHRHARRPATKLAVASVRPARHRGDHPPASKPAESAPTAQPPRAGTPGNKRSAPRPPAPAAPPQRGPRRPAAPAPPAPSAPSAPPVATTPPAAAVTPAVGPPAAAPAPAPATPGPSPACTDHSHASEQGLAHGKGHQRC